MYIKKNGQGQGGDQIQHKYLRTHICSHLCIKIQVRPDLSMGRIAYFNLGKNTYLGIKWNKGTSPGLLKRTILNKCVDYPVLRTRQGIFGEFAEAQGAFGGI
jgi:hypothetical protein